MAVNVTKMNVEYDQSRACIKDLGKMSRHKISLLTPVGVMPTTTARINSKDFIISQYGHRSNYSPRFAL